MLLLSLPLHEKECLRTQPNARIAGLVWMLFLLPAVAQETPPKAPSPAPVVVTVSAQALPVESAPASVQVISREEVESSGAESVADLLQFSSLVHVNRVGGPGGRATATVRGGEPNHTLILINGIPVNDLTDSEGGAYDLSQIGLEGVERIEIVSGPLSSVYGSEATGGVVNIILRTAGEGKRLSAAAGGGNLDRGNVSVGLSAPFGAWDLFASASLANVGDYAVLEDFQRKEAVAGAGWSSPELGMFRVTGRWAELETAAFAANGGGPLYSILKDLRRDDSTEALLGLSWERLQPEGTRWTASFDWFRHEMDSDIPAILDGLPPSPASQPSIRGTSDFRRMRASAGGTKQILNGLTAGVQFQFKRETGESDFVMAEIMPSVFELERNTWAVGSELLYRDSRWTAQAAFRFDRPEGYEWETSPRVAVEYRLVPEAMVDVSAAWSEGFKLPSFYALGEPNVGNRDLRPEHSNGFEVGLAAFSGEGVPRLSITVFRTEYEDLVDFSPELFRLLNRAKVRARGTELSAEKRFEENLRLGGYLSYLDLDNLSGDDPLRDRPRWRGGWWVTWKPSALTGIQYEQAWVGERYDFQVPVPDRQTAEAYSRANLSVWRRLTENLKLTLRFDNLFDQEYEPYVGFPDPGIAWWVTLRCQLPLE